MNKELEALQKLHDLVEYLTRIDYVSIDLRNEVKELLTKHYEDSNGLFSQIEEALKRNEPMKPIWVKDCSYIDWACPSCRGYTVLDEEYRLRKYCPNCGQKLDWSSEK